MTQTSNFFKNTPERYQTLLICFLLVVSTTAVYFQVHDFEFINYDDDDYVSANPHIEDGLTVKGIAWAFTTTHAGNWHPLTWVSHMADVRLFGIKAGAHHLSNLFFHTLNTLILFLAFVKMTRCRWKSAFVAALFALHPMHVESVAWVSERKDVLSGFFWMLIIWIYAGYVQRPSFLRYLWILLFFVFGLMSKPMLVTLPCVLLLLDFWPLKRIRFNSAIDFDDPGTKGTTVPKFVFVKLVLEKIPLFIITALSSGATFYAQKHGGAVVGLETIPFTARAANSLVAYAGYIGKLFFPVNLGVIYPHERFFAWWEVAGAGTMLLFITVIFLRSFKKYPYFSVGWFWFLGTLVPVIGIVQVGSQAMADRYTYIPYVGLFIGIAWGIPDLIKQWRFSGTLVKTGGILVLALLMGLTWRQAGFWKNSRTLFEHTLAVTANNYTAHNNLGSAMYEFGDSDAALSHYRESVKINPDYAKGHYNLGVLLEEKGERDGAIRHYSESIRVNPNSAKSHFNLGVLFEAKGMRDEAAAHYLTVIDLNPQNHQAYNNLGAVLMKKGRIDEAIIYFQKALEKNSAYEKAHFSLGVAFNRRGNYDESVLHYQKALELNPDFEQARNNLCVAYVYAGKIQQAKDCFQKSLEINPENQTAKENYQKALMFFKSAP